VHPDVLERFDIPASVRTYVAEIDLAEIARQAVSMGDVSALPRFQAVVRDFALVMKQEVPAGDVMATIAGAAGSLSEAVELFDVYTGASIEEGYKSVAYSVTLRASDRTLTDEEVAAVNARILKACEQKHGARLRA